MHKYRASGAAPVGGVIGLLLVAIIAGIAAGAILWAVDNYLHLYLVGLFPLLAGALVGAILLAVVRGSKIRSPLIAGLIGLIGGLLIFSTYHAATYYITFRGQVRDTLAENGGKALSDEELDAQINDFLQEEVGDTDFVGYIKLAAQEGITISRTTSLPNSDSGIELKDNVLLVYWAAELLLVAFGVAIAAARAAGGPFDETNGMWYGPLSVFALTTTKSRKELVNALKKGEFAKAGSLLTQQPLKYPHVEVWTRRGQDPAGDVFLQVVHMQRKGRPNIVKKGMITANEFSQMSGAMNSAAQMPVPPIGTP